MTPAARRFACASAWRRHSSSRDAPRCHATVFAGLPPRRRCRLRVSSRIVFRISPYFLYSPHCRCFHFAAAHAPAPPHVSLPLRAARLPFADMRAAFRHYLRHYAMPRLFIDFLFSLLFALHAAAATPLSPPAPRHFMLRFTPHAACVFFRFLRACRCLSTPCRQLFIYASACA